MSINTAYNSAESIAEDSSVATLQTLSIIADLAESTLKNDAYLPAR